MVRNWFLSQVNGPSKVCDFMTYLFFNTQHEFVIRDDQKVGDRLFLYHLSTFFSCGMFNNPHLSVHPQSIQSGESKHFRHARSMQALYGWISMNECLGVSEKKVIGQPGNHWNERDWVEMKYFFKKKVNVRRFPRSPCLWNLFWVQKTTSLRLYFSKLCFCRHLRSFKDQHARW